MSAVALAISASARPFSIALRRGESIVSAAPDGADNANDLTAVVQGLFAVNNIDPRVLDEIRIDLGPGSYTGLRVAVTFARVLATFGRAKLFTATSLELMALAAQVQGTVASGCLIRPVLDARRNRFHHAAIRIDDRVRMEASPRASQAEELIGSIRPGDAMLADRTLHESLSEPVRAAGGILHAASPFDAELLFHSALDPAAATCEELEPLYLMGSYAE